MEEETQSASSSEEGTHEDAEAWRRKGRPTFERARNVIQELYPDGVPKQSAEPNANLCRRVGEKLKKAGLRTFRTTRY
jgi:hypothetical protein